MLFRAGADVSKISADRLPDLVHLLGAATAQWTARLSAGHTAASSVLNDAMLTAHCFHSASAVAAGQAVEAPSDISVAFEGHVDMVQQNVLQQVDQDAIEPIDVDDACANLFALLSDANAEAGNKVKRTRMLNTDWRSTDQQSAVLNILSHCTLDLAVGANIAMDVYQELLLAAEAPVEQGGVTDADLEEAETRAVEACTKAWVSVKAVVEIHTVFVMNHVADPTMKQALCSSTMETIMAVQAGLEAIFRGELDPASHTALPDVFQQLHEQLNCRPCLTALYGPGLSEARLPGDFPALMAILGMHLSIAQTVCCLNVASNKLLPRLVKLAEVLLSGCCILSDGQDQLGTAADTPIQSPLQGLSEHQEQEYITELLQATFTMLGLLRMQSESNDQDSMVDTNLGAGWLFSGIAALTTQVSAVSACILCTTEPLLNV